MRFAQIAAVLLFGIVARAGAQSLPKDAGGNPLAIGEAAMAKGDFAAAQIFFAKYVADIPKDSAAWLDLAAADLYTDKLKEAANALHQCVLLKPNDWNTHNQLALTYAAAADWPAFEKESGAIKAARDTKALGTNESDGFVVDSLKVGNRTYAVQVFDTPSGFHHTRYRLFRFSSNGHPTEIFECDSDDGDQVPFQKDFPKEAAAGARRFSLDHFVMQDGEMVHQPMICFYDGEPTYEALREDITHVVEGLEKQEASSHP